MVKNILRFPVLLTAIIGVIVSITAFSLAYEYESGKAISHFKHDAMNRISVIRRNIEKDVLLMEALKNFFHTTGNVSREEFKTYSSYFVGTNDGLRALEWIPIIESKELSKYQRRAEKEGIHNYKIYEVKENGLLMPSSWKSVYYPAFYIEPLEGNERLLGLDHGADKISRTAIEKAIESDSLIATERIKESYSGNINYSFMLFQPIYSDPKDIKTLKGFVAGIFEPAKLINGALKSLQPLPIDITLIDQSAPVDQQLLHFHDSVYDKLKQMVSTLVDAEIFNPVFVGETIPVGGRNWLIKCVPEQKYLDEYRTRMPWITLFVSFCIMILVIKLIRKNLEETDRVRELVEKKTYELNQMKKRFELAVDGADLALWDWHIETDDVYMNDRWAQMLGFEKKDISPTTAGWKKLLHPNDKEDTDKKLKDHLEGKTDIYRAEYRMQTIDGSWKWILDTGKVFERDADGRALRATGIHLDITDSKEKEQLLEKMSVTDHLTQIYNRVRLHEELNKEIERFVRYNIKFSLIMFDIDHFKHINDTYGHDAGDSILVELTQVVQDNIRTVDLFARWGGEEFMILAPNIGEEQADQFAEKIRMAIEEHEFGSAPHVTCSFGVCEYKERYNNVMFLKKVDNALYQAKETGRNCVRVEI